MAWGARNPQFDTAQIALADVPGSVLVPVLPGVRSAPQRLALPAALHHRSRGEEDRRHVHADRAHEETRSRLVAAAHEDRTVDRVRPEEFLGLHRQHVPIHHRRWLLEVLRQRDRRQLQGEAPRLDHASLDVVDAVAEVRVARVDVTPGVEDRDDGAAAEVRVVVPHLLEP